MYIYIYIYTYIYIYIYMNSVGNNLGLYSAIEGLRKRVIALLYGNFRK